MYFFYFFFGFIPNCSNEIIWLLPPHLNQFPSLIQTYPAGHIPIDCNFFLISFLLLSFSINFILSSFFWSFYWFFQLFYHLIFSSSNDFLYSSSFINLSISFIFLSNSWLFSSSIISTFSSFFSFFSFLLKLNPKLWDTFCKSI